ncbi:T9SS type A sorting domain-containing protein [Flavobacterium sp. 5]|uniref:DUF7619 domain-containing protein n=1 Tax=Flavobacterium sp. 5 TaxID=2035199 RepID=UPI000C2CA27C|nr:T9SS type A sorting domain-containing protein [Flavobacterium sp. 5]PKB17169.1 putative repeat protein (TIGR01451 family)/predicted secreted protein (Por secretion system target) [Flavobacterium sp. 5]
MRKFYTFLFLLISFFSEAQIVNIPDPVCKRYILYFARAKDLAGNPVQTIDTSNDGEIQEDEALQISSLTLNKINGESMITSLEGISKFINLKYFSCEGNQITSLDLTNAPNLEELNCISNKLTTLKIAGLTNLKVVDCYYNQITELDLNGLVNLKKLNCYGNEIPEFNFTSSRDLEFLDSGNNKMISLDLSNLTKLETVRVKSCVNLISINLSGLINASIIEINDNALQSLNLTGLVNLKGLNCRYNQLSSLDITGLNSLVTLDCAYNKLSSLKVKNSVNLSGLDCSWNELVSLDLLGLESLGSLDCRGNLLTSLDVKGCANLNNLGCGNNNFTTLDVNGMSKLTIFSCGYNKNLVSLYMKTGSTLSTRSDYTYDYFEFGSNPNLRYICADERQIYETKRHMTSYGYKNCEINSYCTFTPGGDYNTIKGIVKFDKNADGCDVTDTVVPNLKLLIVDSFGNTKNLISDDSGNYFIPLLNGTYKITPVFEDSNYFIATPPAIDVDFQTLTNTITQDFCITQNAIHTDLEVVLMPIEVARPGFDVKYKIVFKNKGNTIESGTVNLKFDDAVLDFVGSNINFSDQSENNISWGFSNLKPLEKREIVVTLNVNAPTEMPAVNNGDSLKFAASISSQETDEMPADNLFQFNHIVVGSYDPNDKTCLEGAIVTSSLIGDYVHYMIRFENTGNFAAKNIVVTDVIDISKFDITTLVATSSSDAFITKISDGNKVEFIFENIELPFDDANNDGYVSFKIKTKPTLAVGSSISNEANIYFDYNFPILTNKATSVFKTVALGNQDFTFSNYFVLYPNPVNTILNINSTKAIQIQSLSVYDILGRLIITVPNADSVSKMDVSKLKTGTYFIKLNSDKGSSSIKFLKS